MRILTGKGRRREDVAKRIMSECYIQTQWKSERLMITLFVHQPVGVPQCRSVTAHIVSRTEILLIEAEPRAMSHWFTKSPIREGQIQERALHSSVCATDTVRELQTSGDQIVNNYILFRLQSSIHLCVKEVQFGVFKGAWTYPTHTQCQ